MSNNYTYLALGDSYTIGEGVPLHESFPYHVIQLLRQEGKRFNAPELIAKTGWTTSELAAHLDHTVLSPHYDFLSLLIGVNNQYREMSSSHYALEFEELLMRCLSLCGEKKDHVIVLSIPDWSLTPFANNRDRNKISGEIAIFNKINHAVSTRHGVEYVDITTGVPFTADLSLLADDQLHYSGKTHREWAGKIADKILRLI